MARYAEPNGVYLFVFEFTFACVWLCCAMLTTTTTTTSTSARSIQWNVFITCLCTLWLILLFFFFFSCSNSSHQMPNANLRLNYKFPFLSFILLCILSQTNVVWMALKQNDLNFYWFIRRERSAHTINLNWNSFAHSLLTPLSNHFSFYRFFFFFVDDVVCSLHNSTRIYDTCCSTNENGRHDTIMYIVCECTTLHKRASARTLDKICPSQLFNTRYCTTAWYYSTTTTKKVEKKIKNKIGTYRKTARRQKKTSLISRYFVKSPRGVRKT